MTEEEKKAIARIERLYRHSQNINHTSVVLTEDTRCLKIVLNLIEKLQEENEELREITNGYNSLKKDSETFGGIPLIIADEKYFNDGIFTVNFIPKDKIREKIKELEEYIVKTEEETCGRCITIGEDMTIRYLKELLEEE